LTKSVATCRGETSCKQQGVQHASKRDTGESSPARPGLQPFLPVPDTDLRAFLDEMAERARFAPEIITAVERDLDAPGG
jgi:hypothetical protein